MKAEELIRNLEYTRKKYEGKFVNTFETNIVEMIDDCIRVVNYQNKEIERLNKALEIARCGYEA